MMESSDWTLYYSDEGYPYYYNAKTGESQWAEYDSTDYSQHQYQSNDVNKTTNEAVEEEDGEDEDEEDDDDEEDDESDEESESGSDEENDEERQARVVDRILEEKFKQFLRTPEGMAAMEAEQARLAKALDKKERKRNVELEKDYVRGLERSKKDDSRNKVVQPSLLGGIFSYVESAASYWSSKKPADPSSSSGKSNKKSQKNSSSSSATATDDHKKQATHRKPHSIGAAGSTEPVEDDAIESGVGPDDRSVRSGSNSSLSSSDHGSVSSDDSDIVTINAPFMSEFANYLSLSSLHANYVVPAHTYLTEHNVYDNTATVVQNVSTTSYTILSNVTSSTLTLTQQGLFYTGAGLLSAFSLLFERLNPVLLSFMTSVVDNRSPSDSDGSNIEGGDEPATSSEATGGAGLYNGGVSPHTKKSSKSKNKSTASPGLGTPRAPTTPRTPRSLPPGYSGGLLPTARVEGVSSVASTPYGTPAHGMPPTTPRSAGPTVTWKVYQDESAPPTAENTPVKAGEVSTPPAAADVSVLTEATGATQVTESGYEEENDLASEGAVLADTSFVSQGEDLSAHPQMDEVYSAPPTPGDGLVYHANPIRQQSSSSSSSSAVDEAASESVPAVGNISEPELSHQTENAGEGEVDEVTPKKLDSDFGAVEDIAESLDLKDIALSEVLPPAEEGEVANE